MGTSDVDVCALTSLLVRHTDACLFYRRRGRMHVTLFLYTHLSHFYIFYQVDWGK